MALLTRDTFDFVLTNELKRAVRSQNFVTLVLMRPRAARDVGAIAQIAGLVGRELRETDLLAADAGVVSMVLLDADLQSAMHVIERLMSRLDHYQFTAPLDLEVGAACCPTHGVDVATLQRAAAEAQTGPRRRMPPGTAQAH